MLKTLLTMGDVHAPLIAEYLAARGRDDIDWVHQLRYGKYQESTRSLQRYFVNEQRLHADRMSAADGRLLCSLGKLSSLCEQPISEKTLDGNCVHVPILLL
jgi:hypothetical protein